MTLIVVLSFDYTVIRSLFFIDFCMLYVVSIKKLQPLKKIQWYLKLKPKTKQNVSPKSQDDFSFFNGSALKTNMISNYLHFF